MSCSVSEGLRQEVTFGRSGSGGIPTTLWMSAPEFPRGLQDPQLIPVVTVVWYLYLWIPIYTYGFVGPANFAPWLQSHLPNLDTIHVIHTDTGVDNLQHFTTKSLRWSKVCVESRKGFASGTHGDKLFLAGGVESRWWCRHVWGQLEGLERRPQLCRMIIHKWCNGSIGSNGSNMFKFVQMVQLHPETWGAKSCALVHCPLPGMLLYAQACEHSRVWEYGQVRSVVTWFAGVSLSLGGFDMGNHANIHQLGRMISWIWWSCGSPNILQKHFF